MPSSAAVAPAVPRLGRGISPKPYRTAYAPFKPSDTEQRLPPLYYRGCWHRVSRDFLFWYYHPGKDYPLPELVPK